MAIVNVGDSETFTTNTNYTIPISGLYRLNCYAQRGSTAPNYYSAYGGGAGGTATGYVILNSGDIIYARPVTIGSRGWHTLTDEGGYDRVAAPGGMGTFFAKTDTYYNNTADIDYYIVAGGGGGGVINSGANNGRGGYQGGNNAYYTGSFAGNNGWENTAGGGSGFRGGNYGYGGRNYTGGCPAIEFDGGIYSPSSTVGGSNTNSCVITLIAVIATNSLCYGATQISKIYYGSQEVSILI